MNLNCEPRSLLSESSRYSRRCPVLKMRLLGEQLLRSGTSVAANYRAVCRSRSKTEFVAKLGVVVEEIDETVFWLELLVESGIIRPVRLGNLQREANELLAIFISSQLTAKGLNSNSTIRKFVNSSI